MTIIKVSIGLQFPMEGHPPLVRSALGAAIPITVSDALRAT